MLKQKINWDELLVSYKSSGLSRSEFCKQNNLSINQFRYRWDTRGKGFKFQEAAPTFEPVSIVSLPKKAVVKTSLSLSIHLPNQIRCDVVTDVNEFSSLLTQLVRLC